MKLEEPKRSNLYMECSHEHSEVTFADGTKAQAVTYIMDSSLACTVAEYEALSAKLMGTPMVLKKVATPFVTEDQKNSPQGMPYETGPYVTFPWRCNTVSSKNQTNPDILDTTKWEKIKAHQKQAKAKAAEAPVHSKEDTAHVNQIPWSLIGDKCPVPLAAPAAPGTLTRNGRGGITGLTYQRRIGKSGQW